MHVVSDCVQLKPYPWDHCSTLDGAKTGLIPLRVPGLIPQLLPTGDQGWKLGQRWGQWHNVLDYKCQLIRN